MRRAKTADTGLPGGVTEVVDGAPALWIRPRLDYSSPGVTTVGNVMPGGFAAYARVFHPAYRLSGRYSGERHPVRWSDIAVWSGRVVHPEMQWETIAASVKPPLPLPLWDEAPETGRMPAELRSRLAKLLLRHTASPNLCWLCFWDGFADVQECFAGPPAVHLPNRTYYLASASVRALCNTEPPRNLALTELSPSLWWPEDRAWCVATEVDFRWTYVGGSAACIAELLADSALEALSAERSHRADWRADRINADAAR